jgi:hypothetical protein
MRLDLGPDIETARAEALALIDRRAAAAAEAIRPAWLAPLDALRLETAGAAGPQNANARAVLDAADQTAAARVAIDTARLAAKAAVRAASNLAEIRAININIGA